MKGNRERFCDVCILKQLELKGGVKLLLQQSQKDTQQLVHDMVTMFNLLGTD